MCINLFCITSSLKSQVTLTANLIRANQTSLELELDKSDSPPIILPVTFNANVPVIIPAPDIKLRACFLDFTYKQEINVECKDFWGYFVLESPEVILLVSEITQSIPVLFVLHLILLILQRTKNFLNKYILASGALSITIHVKMIINDHFKFSFHI